jgi:RNA recognition motif-containing protein
MNRKLYVGNLSFNTEDSSLESLFAEAGPVRSARIMRDKTTGQSRGFGFVEMETDEGARDAIEKFNGAQLDGRRLTVNEARPQTPGGGGGGGGYRGGGGGGGYGGGGGGGYGGGGGRGREPRW